MGGRDSVQTCWLPKMGYLLLWRLNCLFKSTYFLHVGTPLQFGRKDLQVLLLTPLQTLIPGDGRRDRDHQTVYFVQHLTGTHPCSRLHPDGHFHTQFYCHCRIERTIWLPRCLLCSWRRETVYGLLRTLWLCSAGLSGSIWQSVFNALPLSLLIPPHSSLSHEVPTAS
jgi:hypothetical protein